MYWGYSMTEDVLLRNTYRIRTATRMFYEQNNRLKKPLKSKYEFIKWIDDGRLIVMGGASGIGKTAFLLDLMFNLAKDNQEDVVVIYANSEMMIQELTMRLIVNQFPDKFKMSNVRNAFRDDNPNVEQNLKLVQDRDIDNFVFVNSQSFSLENIMEIVRRARKKDNERVKALKENGKEAYSKKIFIAIDYLQLLLLDKENLQQINSTLKQLKDCLVDNNANAFIVSSLNREAFKNNNIEMNAFRDSSAIEYTSDLAVMLCAGLEGDLKLIPGDNERQKLINYVTLKCIKNRIGKFFSEELIFDKMCQTFERYNEKNKVSNVSPY